MDSLTRVNRIDVKYPGEREEGALLTLGRLNTIGQSQAPASAGPPWG